MDSPALFANLKTHLSNTQAKIYQPHEPDYNKIQQCFVDKPTQTLSIVRPQSAEDVATIIQFCLSNNVEFCVRTGGHDCASRTIVDGTLVVDMRDIKHVTVAEDGQSAQVGGGILSAELCEVLGQHGLTTPV
jgi:FAD/FMN-containing dehydrogenase